MELSGVVVGRIHHIAIADPGGRITHAIRIGAIIQTHFILTDFPVVAGLAHTATDRVFYGTPSVEGAVGLAILHTAIFGDIRRCAHGGPEAIANAVFFAVVRG
jgi:hypothetical protein